MRPAEVVRELRALGFTLHKKGREHDIYRRGDIVMPVVRGSRCNPRTEAELRVIRRRVMRERKNFLPAPVVKPSYGVDTKRTS